MSALNSLLSRLAQIGAAPRCAECGRPTELESETIEPGTPAILESVFRCTGCGVRSLRCLLATSTD